VAQKSKPPQNHQQIVLKPAKEIRVFSSK